MGPWSLPRDEVRSPFRSAIPSQATAVLSPPTVERPSPGQHCTEQAALLPSVPAEPTLPKEPVPSELIRPAATANEQSAFEEQHGAPAALTRPIPKSPSPGPGERAPPLDLEREPSERTRTLQDVMAIAAAAPRSAPARPKKPRERSKERRRLAPGSIETHAIPASDEGLDSTRSGVLADVVAIAAAGVSKATAQEEAKRRERDALLHDVMAIAASAPPAKPAKTKDRLLPPSPKRREHAALQIQPGHRQPGKRGASPAALGVARGMSSALTHRDARQAGHAAVHLPASAAVSPRHAGETSEGTPLPTQQGENPPPAYAKPGKPGRVGSSFSCAEAQCSCTSCNPQWPARPRHLSSGTQTVEADVEARRRARAEHGRAARNGCPVQPSHCSCGQDLSSSCLTSCPYMTL